MSKFPRPTKGSGYNKNPLQLSKDSRKARRASERRRRAGAVVLRGDSMFRRTCAMYAPKALYACAVLLVVVSCIVKGAVSIGVIKN